MSNGGQVTARQRYVWRLDQCEPRPLLVFHTLTVTAWSATTVSHLACKHRDVIGNPGPRHARALQGPPAYCSTAWWMSSTSQGTLAACSMLEYRHVRPQRIALHYSCPLRAGVCVVGWCRAATALLDTACCISDMLRGCYGPVCRFRFANSRGADVASAQVTRGRLRSGQAPAACLPGVTRAATLLSCTPTTAYTTLHRGHTCCYAQPALASLFSLLQGVQDCASQNMGHGSRQLGTTKQMAGCIIGQQVLPDSTVGAGCSGHLLQGSRLQSA
jgi:hypothetical protein